MSTEFDTRLRREAMRWLTVRTHDGAESISSADLLDFEIDGRQFRLLDAQRGIRKPKSSPRHYRSERSIRPTDRTGPMRTLWAQTGYFATSGAAIMQTTRRTERFGQRWRIGC